MLTFASKETTKNNTHPMEESIKQIGERLRGLRDALDIPAEEMARVCDTSLEHYLQIEAGEADPSVYRLARIAKKYDVDLNVLLFGEEPRMSAYFLTRKGQGQSIDRNKNYKYQSLAAGFIGRKANPFLTRVDPKPDGHLPNKNRHDGQEFDYMLEGTLEITIGERTLTLNEGDSIYFDATQPHRMRALGGQPATFICIVF